MRSANACSSIATATLAGRRHRRIGTELRPRAGREGAWGTADGNEANPFRTPNDSAEPIRADSDHRPGWELELAAVGHQSRLPLEGNVDLFLIRVESLGAVLVVRIPVPVGRQREDLHAPGRHAELGSSPTGQAAVDRVHIVDRLE